MSSSSAPGSPACTCCTGCAARPAACVCFEAGADVGGTWYWNRYPGARCDVESMEYSYAFDDDLQQEWEWTEKYATQPEILRYAQHVADRFDLRPRHPLRHPGAQPPCFDEAAGRWTVTTDDGAVTAPGSWSWPPAACPRPTCPTSRGWTASRARLAHTGHWPHEGVDFAGKRVGIIGTGSSGHPGDPGDRRDGRPT